MVIILLLTFKWKFVVAFADALQAIHNQHRKKRHIALLGLSTSTDFTRNREIHEILWTRQERFHWIRQNNKTLDNGGKDAKFLPNVTKLQGNASRIVHESLSFSQVWNDCHTHCHCSSISRWFASSAATGCLSDPHLYNTVYIMSWLNFGKDNVL